MANKAPTQEDVRKAWSEKVGKVDQYDLHEVEVADGEFQTQLIDKDTGSITVAVNGKGEAVLRKLFEHAGDTFIDGGESPLSATSEGSVKRFTSRGVLATPTQPEVQVNTQDPVEVNTKGDVEGRSEAQAPVDRQPSTGSVQLTGDGGEKKLKGTSVPTPKTEGERAREEGIENVVAREKAKKEGTSVEEQTPDGAKPSSKPSSKSETKE